MDGNDDDVFNQTECIHGKSGSGIKRQREFRQALANGGYGHHQAIIYGNHVKELQELGKIVGFDVEYFH